MISFVRLPVLMGLFVCLLAIGCGQPDRSLPTDYGRRTGRSASSVNGTTALAGMFQKAGYYVTSREVISPSVLQHDVIVWVPADFDGPSQELRQTIFDWLAEDEGRTFIYIGRDYDAAIQYWEEVYDQVPASQKLDAMRQQSLAIRDFDYLRSSAPETADYYFFKTDRDTPTRVVDSLSGPWANGIDVSKTNIVLRTKIEPPTSDELYDNFDAPEDNLEKLLEEDVWGEPDWDEFDPYEDIFKVEYVEDVEVLLGTDDEAIVTRLGSDISENQILIVNNGSFLFNLPLVNSEHRKLAAKLVNQCDRGYSDVDSVCFLETNGGVIIRTGDEVQSATTGWEWLSRWPLNLIGLQTAWWLIILCFALYPIFGRPKRLPEANTSDFGQHIESVGELLEATLDYQYAQQRLQQYEQIMKGDTVYRRSKSRRSDGK